MIAGESKSTEYVPITITVNARDYEVLRVSRFHEDYDGDKSHVQTPIREFNDKVALHSRATRDLGVVRVITNSRKPAFVIEPGADALEWVALIQGVSVKKLVAVMRAGDLGRRVRSRDRTAAKNSRTQLAAVEAELTQELAELRDQEKRLAAQLKAMENERDNAIKDRDRMKENLIKQNAEQSHLALAPSTSGTKACALGTAQDRGVKLTSNKPLPGNFKG